jgi:hypothetical protein
MGYYVQIRNADFIIPDTEGVLNALRELNKRDDLKRGGVYTGGEMTERWFSWMPAGWENSESVADIFGPNGLGFEVAHYSDTDENNKVTNTWVRLDLYDNKSGQEELFLATVAPFVRPGSFIEWVGEDNTMWRDYVGIDHLLYRQDAETVWTNAHVVTV